MPDVIAGRWAVPTYTTVTARPVYHGNRLKIEPLTSADEAALKKEIALGRRICEFYVDAPVSVDFAALDDVLDCWLLDERQAKPSANEVAIGLGSLVGDHLRSRYGCRWAVVTDHHGCDLGMLDDATGWMVFPRHWLAKRLDRRNAGTGTISSIVRTLQEEGVVRDE